MTVTRIGAAAARCSSTRASADPRIDAGASLGLSFTEWLDLFFGFNRSR
jgi:hypothetical protein